MGGAMDLAASHTRLIVTMTHTTKVISHSIELSICIHFYGVYKEGRPKILEKCHFPLTAHKCVDRIITDLVILFKFTYYSLPAYQY
jgi:acyl CoA:acetate/3-ketoacid CoA transferase beta subunit